VSLRPERIRLCSLGEATSAVNTVKGVVVRRIFLGHLLRAQVEISPGLVLTVECPRGQSGLLTGDEAVALTWNADDVVVLSLELPS